MHERHGGETDAQRQDMLATATAHEGTTIYIRPLILLVRVHVCVRCPCPTFPYTRSNSRQCKHVSIAIRAGTGSGCQHMAAHAVRNRPCLPVYEHRRTSLGCVALAVLLSGFRSSSHLICCTDRTVMLKGSLLWAAWSLLDCLLLATVVKVSV